ncbi:hypothetical protein CBR_g29487 [Chara braunii]|uniref:Myb/SANT-like DNA-binding domain-containing protein n=1 Tax=Chara braunii TaxID=69332 RepID=A0A388LAJ1_CHABU|nr:hypothetical protein CBR_g29487 [Chara braunii]|eukprot:GBG79337.1 hypothetical protein CBR_g29487 [Chara braunii]
MDGGSFTSQLYNESGGSQGMEVCEDMDTHLESSRYRASLSAVAWQYVPDSQLSADTRSQFVAQPAHPRAPYVVGSMDSSSPFRRGTYLPQSHPHVTQPAVGGTALHSPQSLSARGGSSRTDAGAWGSNPQQSSHPSPHRPQVFQLKAKGETGNTCATQDTSARSRECSVDDGGTGRPPKERGAGKWRQGGKSTAAPKKNTLWTLEERVLLAKISGEDDALMGDAEGAHSLMTKGRRYDWIADRMKDEGYARTGEDCRKKWAELQKKVREIRDACDGSGKQPYRDLTTEERKKLNIPMTFERPLWDAMEWYRLKVAFTMDNYSAAGSEAGSEGGGTETSGGAPKTRRTNSGKVRGSDVGQGVTAMAAAMEDTSRTLCEGLDRAAGTLASATTEGAALMAARQGDMATEIGHVAGAMRQGNSVLELLVGVMAGRRGGAPAGEQGGG